MQEGLELERTIELDKFVYGCQKLRFMLLGDAGSGKTVMMKYLNHWINSQHDEIMKCIMNDTSTYYYEGESEVVPPGVVSFYFDAAVFYNNFRENGDMVDSIYKSFLQSENVELNEEDFKQMVKENWIILLLDNLEAIEKMNIDNFMDIFAKDTG